MKWIKYWAREFLAATGFLIMVLSAAFVAFAVVIGVGFLLINFAVIPVVESFA